MCVCVCDCIGVGERETEREREVQTYSLSVKGCLLVYLLSFYLILERNECRSEDDKSAGSAYDCYE